MRVIVSPTKQMKHSDSLAPAGSPALLDRSRSILDWLKQLSPQQAQKLWGCSKKLAASAFESLQRADLDSPLAEPAILCFDGIAFKYMAPSVFTYDEFDYVQEHLRILSALYGCLRPMDGIVEYRLEMQQRAQVGKTSNLYEFWGDSIYAEVMRSNDDRIVINLASREYSRCIQSYLSDEDTFVTCTFAQELGGKLVQKGVWCKMARGEMVRFMAKNKLSDPNQLKDFDSPDWQFSPTYSSFDNLVFLHRD